MKTTVLRVSTWGHSCLCRIDQRLREARSERGATTLEYAVIAGAMIVVAIGLGALIATAVDNHSSSIN